MFEDRMIEFRRRLAAAGVDVALITDDDNVYYLTGYYNYLHMEFGRPTILVVQREGDSLLVTPTIDLTLAEATARVDRIAAWNDGAGEEWRAELPGAVSDATTIGIEPNAMPPLVRACVDGLAGADRLTSVMPILADMRMIKSPEELQLTARPGRRRRVHERWFGRDAGRRG